MTETPEPEPTKRYRVPVAVTVIGYIDVEARGTRSARTKAQEVLTSAPNPVAHVTPDRTPITQVDTRHYIQEVPHGAD